MISNDKLSEEVGKLWGYIKENYSIADKVAIRQKIDQELSDWSSDAEHNLLVNNPFYGAMESLQNAQNDYDKKDYAISSIRSDLAHYSTFKRQIDSEADSFWQNELNDITQREGNTASIDKLKARFSTRDEQALDDSIRGELQKGYDAAALLLRIKEDKKLPSLISNKQLLNDKRLKKRISEINGALQDDLSRRQGLRGSLLKKWQQELDEAIAAWELKQLEELRKQIFARLSSWLDLITQLSNALESLSIAPGRLFDLSNGQLAAQDISELKKWADYIEQDAGVKQLCDMLGKLRKALQLQKEKTIKVTHKIKTQVPDINSKNEITGVVLGNDLENIIPEELALLADDSTADLFDLKFMEKRLLCFENQGLIEVEHEEEKEQIVQVTEEDEMGPIIICVDTSGSMHGAPEVIAKAVTLYMATRAMKQDRKCYLINFSTNISTLDLSAGLGLKDLLGFLKMSFHGGTDASPALKEALRQLQSEDYEQADILVVSDFVMSGLPEEITKSIGKAKEDKNKFYSLCIGNHFYSNDLKLIFDKSWVYNSQAMKIQELSSFMMDLA